MHRLLPLAPLVGIVLLLAACAADRLATAGEEDVLAIHWVTTEIAPLAARLNRMMMP